MNEAISYTIVPFFKRVLADVSNSTKTKKRRKKEGKEETQIRFAVYDLIKNVWSSVALVRNHEFIVF